MQVPSLPGPDQVIERILIALFGRSAAIVVLFVVVNFVWAWYTLLRGGSKITWRGILAVSQLSGRLFKLGPVGVSLGLVISVVVLALQAMWLGLSYIVGNGLSWFFIGNRPEIDNGSTWNPFITGLRWDWVSGMYAAGAAVTLLLAYQAVFYADLQARASRAMTIFTVPLILVGVLSGLAAIVAGVASVINPNDTFVKAFPLKAMALIAVVAGAYIVASRTIARTPPLIVRVWRPIREGDPEAYYHRYPNPGYPSRVPASRRTTMPTMVIIGVVVLAIVIGMGLGGRHSNHIAQSRPPVASAFPPLHTKLICIPGGGGFYCKGTLHWNATLTLSVQGLTHEVIDRLCAKGYTSRWSQNMDGYIEEPTMCPGSNPLASGPDFGLGNKYWNEDFQPPTRTGRWVIVWRLYDPSARLVRSARYRVRVAPP